jgi:hypothetical protein
MKKLAAQELNKHTRINTTIYNSLDEDNDQAKSVLKLKRLELDDDN